jgi:hypothetical protein
MDLKEYDVDSSTSEYVPLSGFCEHNNYSLGSIKKEGLGFLDWLSSVNFSWKTLPYSAS